MNILQRLYNHILFPYGCAALAIGVFILLPHAASAVCNANDPSCDSCISGAQFNDPNFGQNLIQMIFSIINATIGNAAVLFYGNIVNSQDYKEVILAGVTLYIATYGAMIMFGMIPFKAYDASVRLIKIAVVYSVADPNTGFSFFYQWIGGPFIEMMNQLITLFNQVGVGNNIAASGIHLFGSANIGNGDNGVLDYNAMSVLAPVITQVFSVKYLTAVLSHLSLTGPGIIVAGILLWALKDFIMTIVGALFTYVKAVVGLTFLFGIAPVFIILILFEKTRQAFLGWLGQVLAYALSPVLLFAFLAFYIGLLTGALNGIVGNVNGGTSAAPDYCYVKWFSFPGGLWDVYWWRPTDANGNPMAGDVAAGTGSPIPAFTALYFMLLCHLGYSFCQYIDSLVADLTGGLGVGMVTGESLGRWAQSNLMGGRSATSVAGGAVSRGVQWITRPGGHT